MRVFAPRTMPRQTIQWSVASISSNLRSAGFLLLLDRQAQSDSAAKRMLARLAEETRYDWGARARVTPRCFNRLSAAIRHDVWLDPPKRRPPLAASNRPMHCVHAPANAPRS